MSINKLVRILCLIKSCACNKINDKVFRAQGRKKKKSFGHKIFGILNQRVCERCSLVKFLGNMECLLLSSVGSIRVLFVELHLKIICQIPGTKPVDTLEKNDSDDYGLEMTELLFGKSA